MRPQIRHAWNRSWNKIGNIFGCLASWADRRGAFGRPYMYGMTRRQADTFLDYLVNNATFGLDVEPEDTWERCPMCDGVKVLIDRFDHRRFHNCGCCGGRGKLRVVVAGGRSEVEGE